MSDLDRSEEYHRKKSLMQDNVVPAQAEIKCRLGDDLAEVLFETCMPALKPYLGLVPVLNGPGDDLWVSPSDLLIGKVRLKPPLTSKYIKALTHEGILKIGDEVEQKLRNEFQIDLQKAVADNEEIVKYVAEKERVHAISRAKEEEKMKYEKIIEDLKSDFNITLEENLQILEAELEIEKNIAVTNAKAEVTEMMQGRMDLAVQETVQRLIEQFGTELLKQSKKLHAHFWYHLRQEKKKLNKAVEEERLRYEEMVAKLRREMQCENIANVMYILAVERHRCSCEKQIIEKEFREQFADLKKEIVDREQELRNLAVENEENVRKVYAREQYLYEIIQQFQKFIYFVLRAVPTQAEYLLNVEKLMIFELTKTLLDTAPEIFDTNNPLTVLKSADKGSSVVTFDDGAEMALVAPDFHNCDNIEIEAESSHTLASNEDLPMFVFNDKTYIREDFRNMISQGLQISNSNTLWSKELENLANSLQPDVASKPLLISDTELDDLFKSKSVQTEEPGFYFKYYYDAKPRCKRTPIKEDGGTTAVNAAVVEIDDAKFSNVRDSIPLTLEKINKNKSTVSIRSTASIDGVDRIFSKANVRGAASVRKVASVRNAASVPHTTGIYSTVNVRNSAIEAKSYQPKLSCYDANLKKETTPCCKTKPKPIETSNFDMHVDSLVLLTRKMYEPKATFKKSTLDLLKPSKLLLTVDSLELLRSKKFLKQTSKPSNLKQNSTNVLWAGKKNRNVSIQFNKPLLESPVDYASRFKRRNSMVSFHVLPTITEVDSDKSEARRNPCKDILNRPKQVKVVGDLTSTEHNQRHDEFTMKRVNSFLSIFRQHPSLRRLFTETSRN